MMSKNKKIINIKNISFILMMFFIFTITTQTTFATYKTLEKIPGIAQNAGFTGYVTGIYNFAIGFVLIAALLMITIGGFYYITSAGNQAQAGTAKKIITDALLGLVVVFLIYLILNTINPDLMNSASPSLGALQQGVQENTTRQNNTQSTKHSNSRVVQKVTRPQTYCLVEEGGSSTYGSVECFNSKKECNDPDCISSQEVFSNNSVYEHVSEDPELYVKRDSMEECEGSNFGKCSLGSNVKAEMLNNVKSSEKIEAEIKNAGGQMTEEAKKDANQMTEKTNKNAQEIIRQSNGGTVKEVNQNGVEYKMQGAKNEKDNGTQNAQEGQTVKGLEKMLIEAPSDQITVKQKKLGNGNVEYTYEFSPDYPNKALRGTVAVYRKTKVRTRDGGYANKYSDVTVVAAQQIKPKK